MGVLTLAGRSVSISSELILARRVMFLSVCKRADDQAATMLLSREAEEPSVERKQIENSSCRSAFWSRVSHEE